MDDWEQLKWISLPEKQHFYSHLNIKDITDADYTHAKRVSKEFEVKNVGEYRDLYVQSDILFWADIFEILRNMCRPTCFLTAPGLAWQAPLKDNKIKLHFLIDFIWYWW